MARLITAPELLFLTYTKAFLFTQYKDVFVIQKKWKYLLDNNDTASRNVVANKKLNWEIISNDLLRFNEKVYIFTDLPLKYKLLQTFYNTFITGYQKVFKTVH